MPEDPDRHSVLDRLLPPARRLYLCALLMDAAFFCGWAAVPFLVRADPALYLDDAQLGFLLAAAGATYVVGAFLLPVLLARHQKALVARIAIVAVGASFVLASYARAAWELYLWLPLGRLALSAYWPNLMGLVGETPHKRLVERIGSFNCWWGTGKAFAFLGAGVLLQALGSPAAAMRVCAASLVVALCLVPRDQPRSPTSHALRVGELPGREAWFLAGLAGVFTAWFLGSVWENQFPEGLGRERFGDVFGARYSFWANQLLFALYLGQACGFYVLRVWKSWPARAWTIVAAVGLVCAAQGLALATTSPVVLGLVLFLMGVGFAVLYAQSLYHAQAGQEAKARRSGIHEGVLTLGVVVGPAVAGTASVMTNSREAPFVLSFALALCVAVVVLRFLRATSSGRLRRPSS